MTGGSGGGIGAHSGIERRRAAVGTAAPEAPVSLAELRRQMGLTQVEMARRVGISQSDLSKLERRSDVRISTLKSYAEAMGGALRVLFVAGSRLVEIRMGPANGRRRKARRR